MKHRLEQYENVTALRANEVRIARFGRGERGGDIFLVAKTYQEKAEIHPLLIIAVLVCWYRFHNLIAVNIQPDSFHESMILIHIQGVKCASILPKGGVLWRKRLYKPL